MFLSSRRPTSRTSSWDARSRHGEAGYNVARVAALLAGFDAVPGVTVNRQCASSLQTIRMAAHAIRSGEGDVFVAAGVETVSRASQGPADTAAHNPHFAKAEARSAVRSAARTEPWTPLEGELPDIYIQMGQTAENVAEFEGVTREEMDEFAVQVAESSRCRPGAWVL